MRRLLRGDRKRHSSSFHQKKEAVVVRTQVKNLPSALQNDLHSYVLRAYDRKMAPSYRSSQTAGLPTLRLTSCVSFGQLLRLPLPVSSSVKWG